MDPVFDLIFDEEKSELHDDQSLFSCLTVVVVVVIVVVVVV